MRTGISWLFSFVSLAIAIFAVLLGLNLLPGRAKAMEMGVIVPFYMTWAMIAVTAMTALVLAWFLAAIGLGRGAREAGKRA